MPAKPLNVSQTGSIVDYISKFQQATANLNDWGDAALMSYFYKGLNDDIKDILIGKEEEARTLEQLMATSARFGKRLEDRRLEKELQSISQESSIAHYVSDFRIMISRFHRPLPDIVLTLEFYRGLSDEIKDEIVRVERPEKLEEMIHLATSIGTRLEERAKEN